MCNKIDEVEHYRCWIMAQNAMTCQMPKFFVATGSNDTEQGVEVANRSVC